jgi:hypothetical protein
MRPALVAVLLVFLAACGGNSSDAAKDPKPSAASTTAADALDQTCAKLGRTWAVAAKDLHSSLGLAVMDAVNSATAAMKAATDQMEIEQCKGEIVTKTAEGNYEAALAAAQAQVCSNDFKGFCKAGDTWQSKGEQIVADVEALSAR